MRLIGVCGFVYVGLIHMYLTAFSAAVKPGTYVRRRWLSGWRADVTFAKILTTRFRTLHHLTQVYLHAVMMTTYQVFRGALQMNQNELRGGGMS